MRSMTVFNYLLEATLFGSVLILLVVAVRLLLRRRLGSRAMYAAWIIVVLRLLLPISFPNPFMDEFRPGFSTDVAARPVAAQVRQRLIDTGYNVSALLPGDGGDGFAAFAVQTSQGSAGRWFLLAWLAVGVLVGAWLLWRRGQFYRRVRKNRVRGLNPQEERLLQTLRMRYGVRRQIAAYYVDRLPASCVAGGERPFIGLPLDTPPEHLALLLSHQLCHYRTHDPFWGLVRCLCCAVHWFNPLVWMAAWLSYRDSEMACDDRVTAQLHDMDRLAYANVIVSEGERENAASMTVSMGASFTDQHIRQRVTAIIRCVRGSRWGIALGSLAAAAVLVFSFATGESEPLPTVDAVPAVAWVSSAVEITNDMDAIAAARRFLESPFVNEDTSGYSFTARSNGAQWLVDAQNGHNRVFLRFARQGSLMQYDGTSFLNGLTFTDNTYTHRQLTGSVQRYVDAFAAALLPEMDYQSVRAAADIRAGDVRLLLGEMYRTSGETVCEFTLQIEPMPRLLSFALADAGR